MMDYEIFKNVICERIMDFLPPIYGEMEPAIQEVTKVNEVKDALVLRPAKDGPAVAMPMIYLDDMYEIFCEEPDLDDMLCFISNVFMSYIGSVSREEFDVDFNDKLDQIFLCLINKERNSKLLQDVPYVSVLDMALIYRIIMRESSDGFDTVLVTNQLLNTLNISKQELHEIALENTKRIFPPRVIDMNDQYCLVSNDRNMFGSTAMIFEDTMKEVASTIESDTYYIVPCSIHEFIAVAASRIEIESLIQMLASGNEKITLPREVLSNSIYSYNINRGSLRKVGGYLEQGIENIHDQEQCHI